MSRLVLQPTISTVRAGWTVDSTVALRLGVFDGEAVGESVGKKVGAPVGVVDARGVSVDVAAETNMGVGEITTGVFEETT
jgi:hypothetical protein